MSRQVSADLGAEAVVLHLDRGVYYGLNEVGARIWQLLQTPVTRDQLVTAILAEYDVEPVRCRADVGRLLDELLSEHLIEVRHHDAQ